MIINMSLSTESIDKAISQLREYQAELQTKCDMISEQLALKGVEIAQVFILDLGAVDTGELFDSMVAKSGNSSLQNGSTWYVYSDCKYATYVEFGTGIVGAQNPHKPLPDFPYEYDYNHHGESGWVYYKNGRFYRTKGFKSRPFMYETGQKLQSIVTETVRSVFA